jgi:hypothetical protein
VSWLVRCTAKTHCKRSLGLCQLVTQLRPTGEAVCHMSDVLQLRIPCRVGGVPQLLVGGIARFERCRRNYLTWSSARADVANEQNRSLTQRSVKGRHSAIDITELKYDIPLANLHLRLGGSLFRLTRPLLGSPLTCLAANMSAVDADSPVSSLKWYFDLSQPPSLSEDQYAFHLLRTGSTSLLRASRANLVS